MASLIGTIARNTFIFSGSHRAGTYGEMYSVEQVRAFTAAQAHVAACAIASHIRCVDWTFVDENVATGAFVDCPAELDMLGAPMVPLNDADAYMESIVPTPAEPAYIPREF